MSVLSLPASPLPTPHFIIPWNAHVTPSRHLAQRLEQNQHFRTIELIGKHLLFRFLINFSINPWFWPSYQRSDYGLSTWSVYLFAPPTSSGYPSLCSFCGGEEKEEKAVQSLLPSEKARPGWTRGQVINKEKPRITGREWASRWDRGCDEIRTAVV